MNKPQNNPTNPSPASTAFTTVSSQSGSIKPLVSTYLEIVLDVSFDIQHISFDKLMIIKITARIFTSYSSFKFILKTRRALLYYLGDSS